MNTELVRDIRKKDERTPVEYEFLKQNMVLSMISEILVDVSKDHLSYEEGIRSIRSCMQDNL
jgi:hypothetical protein